MCAGASKTGGKRAEALRNCLQVLPQDSLFGRVISCKNINMLDLLHTSKEGWKPNHGGMFRKTSNQDSSLSFLT